MNRHQRDIGLPGRQDDPRDALSEVDVHRLAALATMFGDGQHLGSAGHQNVPVGSSPDPHSHTERIFGIDDNRLSGPLEDFGFEFGHLLRGVDPFFPDVVILHVEQRRDVIVIAGVTKNNEALARHLHNRRLHSGVVQHDPGSGLTGKVVGADDVIADP